MLDRSNSRYPRTSSFISSLSLTCVTLRDSGPADSIILQEHHLQAAISAHQAAAVGSKDSKKVFIPTPNTTELSAEHYEKLYPKRFQQPFSYIRSSATVEDSSGALYCMSEADEKYLTKLNSARAQSLPRITEEEFETIMDLYESTIQQNQPFLSLDVSNILPFQEMEHAFDDNLEANLKAVAKLVYSYWKEQKIVRDGRSIIPALRVSSSVCLRWDGLC